MSRTVIVSGARTPIGKLSGAFASLSAQDLGGYAIKGALERAGISGELVDAVLMGQVIQAGQGQITARQAAVRGGVPMSVNATTINKVCLSGLQTIYLADLMIKAGEADIVIAGGMESMTNAPYLLPGARSGYRIGDQSVIDSMMFDGLTCAFDHCAMGLGTENYNGGKISRQRQDEFSARSHQLAAAAIAAGKFDNEIVGVSIPQRKGEPIVVTVDEGVRGDTTAESLGGLRPAFTKDGTITAGNASQISDGGAAVLVMSEAKAKELGLTPLGEIVSYGQVAGPDASLLLQPANAIAKAAAKAGDALILTKAVGVGIFSALWYVGTNRVGWIVGVLLLLIILAFALTGYLLPWDQKAYWATAVGTNIAPGVTDRAVTTIDVTGCTVMPGLIDAHCHITFGEPASNDELFFHRDQSRAMLLAAHNVPKLLRAGVTGFLDADCIFDLGPALRRAMEY